MVKIDIKDESYYYDGYLLSNLKIAKKYIKKDFDMVFIVDGQEGCLSGDTEIQISKGKLSKRYTIQWLYNQFNNNPDKLKYFKQMDLTTPLFCRSYNGKDIKLHKINDVLYSGKKIIYKLTLENDLNIKATKEHKFLTKDGWKELKDLNLGIDELMCDTLKAEKSNRKTIKLYDILLRVKYHPFGKNRIEVHRLIYEAYLNNLDFLEYIDILLNEPEKAKTLKFITPKKYHIHHIDGNHYNNSKDNLKLILISEHLKYHSNNSYKNFSQGTPKFSKVKKIEFIGESDTYDIICEEPHHNFVANGIIVHNSGKSVFAQQMALYLDNDFIMSRIVFTPSEFEKKVKEAKKGQAIIYDEAYSGLSSRQAMSSINRTLVSMLTQIRQKNLYIFIVMPCFFELDKYPAIWRSRGLLNVYTKGFNRGYFGFYNFDRKKILYLKGKKFYQYSVKPNFRGCFTKKYVVDEKAYRKLKNEALSNVDEFENKYLIQRNSLLKLCSDYKITQIQMSKGIEKYSGYKLNRATISKILTEVKAVI